MGHIEVRQLNCNHSIASGAELAVTIPNLDSFVYLIQEPYVVHGCLKDAPRGVQVYTGGPNPKAAIYCSNDVKATFVQKYSDSEVTTCLITSPKYNFYIFSAYSDINNNYVPVKLQDLSDFCVSKNKELVGGIDTNAHSKKQCQRRHV